MGNIDNLPIQAFRIGQDSEFFLLDKKTGAPVKSWELFPEKEKAYVEKGSYARASIKSFRDGLAVEVNSPPEGCRAYILNHVRDALQTPPKEIQERYTSPQGDLELSTVPLVKFSDEFMKDFPPDLKTLGCMPTYDAYKESLKVLDVEPEKLRFRTSGAHFHMGHYYYSPKSAKSLPIPPEYWTPWTKAADLFLGVPFAFVFNEPEEFERRKLYGQAGEFRHQEYAPGTYGLEYRVLSSRVWEHNGIASLFLGLFKYALQPDHVKALARKWDKAWDSDIQEAINTGDEKAQQRALKLWSEHLPNVFNSGNLEFSYQGDLEKSLSFWSRLRELRKQGALYQKHYLDGPEGHMGFSEYDKQLFSPVKK